MGNTLSSAKYIAKEEIEEMFLLEKTILLLEEKESLMKEKELLMEEKESLMEKAILLMEEKESLRENEVLLMEERVSLLENKILLMRQLRYYGQDEEYVTTTRFCDAATNPENEEVLEFLKKTLDCELKDLDDLINQNNVKRY